MSCVDSSRNVRAFDGIAVSQVQSCVRSVDAVFLNRWP